MAKEKGQQQRETNSRSAGETKNTDNRSSVWASRLRAVVILLVVGVGAIFSGYAVGNYVMGWFFGDSGVNAPSGSIGTLNTGTTGSGATRSAAVNNTGTAGGGSTNTGTISPISTTAGTTSASPTSTNANGGTNPPRADEYGTSASAGSTAAPTSESEVLYRVRVGAFATPEEAEPDLRRLKERGYEEAYVVKSDDGSAYHIQVGAFSSSRSAFNVEEQLRAAGFAVHIETVQRR